MDQVEVKFGEWIEKGFGLYKRNIILLILATFIALVLSAASLGILAGPMAVGLYLITLGLLDGKEPKPEVGDLFKGFAFFLNSLLFFIVWGVIIMVGYTVLRIFPLIGDLAASVFAFAVQALLIFALFLIGDQHMDFWPASMESIDKVKRNFWPFLGLIVVSSVIGGIGAIAFGIGVIVTLPIHICIITVAYRDVYGPIGESGEKEESTG